MKNKAIIFNCLYNGLSIIQELSRHGVECIAMDCRRSIGAYSRYAEYVKCPDPSRNEMKFVEFLYNYCKKQEFKPVIFPTNDNWSMAVSKYKNLLKEVSYLCVGDWDAVQITLEKARFYERGEINNWLTPITWKIEDVNKIMKENYPIVAKPQYRRISSNDDIHEILDNMDRLRLTVINSETELKAFIEREKRYIKYLIFQEYIAGMSDCMYTVGIYADDKSEILGLFTGRKVRGFPADIGDCIVGENHSVPSYVIDDVYKIVKQINYKGIAEFEFKKDVNTEKFRLMEINPRSWSWIGITPACGVSLPLIAYRDLTGEEVEAALCSLPDGSVKYLKVLQDYENCLLLYKKSYPKWHMSYTQWKQDIKAPQVIYAEFNEKDIMVSIKAVSEILSSFIKAAIKNLFIKLFKRGNKNDICFKL